MMAATVSVVIPAFNAERFLGAALESVFAQTVRPVEVIVVDDGSRDGTVGIAEGFPGLTLLRKKHRGVSAARNAGVAHSTGDLVAFLDADDVWAPRKLEEQLAVALRHPGAGVVMTWQSCWFEGAIPAWFTGRRDGGPEPGFQPSTWLVRRPAWDTVGPFDERVTHGEDMDWLARASDTGIEMVRTNTVLVTRRIHDANVSGQRAEVREGVLTALRASVQRKREATPGA